MSNKEAVPGTLFFDMSQCQDEWPEIGPFGIKRTEAPSQLCIILFHPLVLYVYGGFCTLTIISWLLTFFFGYFLFTQIFWGFIFSIMWRAPLLGEDYGPGIKRAQVGAPLLAV